MVLTTVGLITSIFAVQNAIAFLIQWQTNIAITLKFIALAFYLASWKMMWNNWACITYLVNIFDIRVLLTLAIKFIVTIWALIASITAIRFVETYILSRTFVNRALLLWHHHKQINNNNDNNSQDLWHHAHSLSYIWPDLKFIDEHLVLFLSSLIFGFKQSKF